MEHQASAHPSLKQRVIEELKAFWITAVYLALFLGAFTFYRRMLLAELGVAYLHYGIAVLEALIIAKVVLIGRALGLDKEVDRRPLIVSVVFRSVIFAALVLLFGILEHTVRRDAPQEGLGEHLARTSGRRRVQGRRPDDRAVHLFRSVLHLFGDRPHPRAG